MGFWIYMLAMDLLIPVTMLVLGRIFLKSPPKKINAMFGYRTARSMRSQEAWDFAHRYCGKIWYRWGMVLLPLSAAVMLLVLGRTKDTIGTVGGILCGLQMLPLIGSIFPTERALKKRFGK